MRLEALTASEELGAGFTLAVHDMEIRGTGELLSKEQSGHIQAIGFELFSELLDRAVKKLKKGEAIDFDLEACREIELKFNVVALIPEHYLPDVSSRLILYKRIASAKTTTELDALRIEMIDRFGLFLPPIENLFRLAVLKLLAKSLGIFQVEANEKYGKIVFNPCPKVDAGKLLAYIQKHAEQYQLVGSNSFRFMINEKEPLQQLEKTEDVLQQLLLLR
jgi:transcription-repair coupling factor (superfamily II helicase)